MGALGGGPESPAKILLVDDDPGGLLAMEALLAGMDVEPVTARSAREALAQLLTHDYALMVLDVRMPDMDGFEMARNLRQHPRFKNTPIIFASALDRSREDMERAYALGAVDILAKPLLEEAFRSKVRIFVELHRAKRILERRVDERTSELERQILERRKGEQAAAFLAQVVRSTNDPVVTKTLDGVITSWNAAAERVFGYRPEEIIGRSIMLLIPEDRQDEERVILAKIARGEAVESFETVRLRKDGTFVDLSVTISPVRDPEGRIVGASKVARDISERKRAEAEIKRLNQILERRVEERTRQLRESLDELEAFTYTVAHDLRSPLRGMAGMAQLLLLECESLLGEQARDYARRIEESSRRMDDLIQGLLRYSQLHHGELRLETVDVDVLLREIAPREGCLRVERPLEKVRGNPLALREVFANLIGNAIKYSKPGSEPVVRVRSERAGDRVRFWVEDEGIGIDPAYHERIFKLFARLNDAPGVEGTGAGLAIVRRAVRRMKGEVGVRSNIDQGSRFWVELAAAEEPATT
jgi:PAS domain S-box-containing protein